MRMGFYRWGNMIEFVYQELRDIGAVADACEFSTEWLGMERNYYSMLRSKGRRPSAKALAHCASRLVAVSQAMAEDREMDVRVKSVRVRCLAQMCVGEMLPEQVRVMV